VPKKTAENVAKEFLAALKNGNVNDAQSLVPDELLKKFTPGNGNALADAGFQVHDYVVGEDAVAARFEFTVNSEAVQDAKPGRQAKISGMAIARVQDGKVTEVHHEIDRLGMLQQLGAM
jgi:predicted ester cyclase